MWKRSIIIFLFLTGAVAFGQNKDVLFAGRQVKPEHVKSFVDSLTRSILLDTARFSRSDLLHTTFTRNYQGYSWLYIIDDRYYYKLDIINGEKVQEFVKEFLNVSKIKKIYVFPAPDSGVIWGINGQNGVICITMNRKYNPVTAGLKLTDKKFGNNYQQRQKGELIMTY